MTARDHPGADRPGGVGLLERVDPPHPRIRARRIEVRRHEGRRRFHRLIGLVVVLTLALVGAGLTRSPLLAVHEVVVTGAVRTTRADILRASGLRLRQPMTDVEAGTAARHLHALPWVEHATVHRHWPRTVTIAVVERVAVAQVASGTGWALVDATGRVLSVGPQATAGVVRITNLVAGRPGSTVDASAGPALDLAAALPTDLAHGVASIARSATNLTMRLALGNIVVKVGAATDLEAKVAALRAILASAAPTPPIRSIDVTVPSAPVLTRVAGVTP